jgi:hypothetical protein
LKKSQLVRNSKAANTVKTKGKAPAKPSRFNIPPKVMRTVAYGIIATSVILSWFITPTPVAVGITLLALIRVGIAVREERNQQAGDETGDVCSVR